MRVNGKPSPSKRISLFNILDANEGFITEKWGAGASFTRQKGTTTAEYIIVMCWWMQGGELRQGPIKAQVIDLLVEPSHLCISDAMKAEFFRTQKFQVCPTSTITLKYWWLWIIERFSGYIAKPRTDFSRQGTLQHHRRMSRVCLLWGP